MATTQKVNRVAPNAKRYIPVAQVSFHTDGACYRLRAVIKGSTAEIDPTDQLISINTNKTLEAPAGTFSIVLAGDSWFLKDNAPILKPNDLVVIYMGYQAVNDTVTLVDGSTLIAADDLDTVMIGLIDTVTCTENGGGNGVAPSIQTTVTGRDFGKLLIKAMLKFYPQIGATNTDAEKFFLTETGWITLFKAFANDNVIKGSPAKILDTIVRFILKPLISTTWLVYDDCDFTPGSTPGVKPAAINNMLRYSFAPTNFFLPFINTAQQYEGSIWNLMSKVNIKPFTELFIDTRDKFESRNRNNELIAEAIEEASSLDKQEDPTAAGGWATPIMFGPKDQAEVLLVFRNTPFDGSAWDKLRTHTLEDVDIVQKTLSYSDNENYNLFWAGATLTPFSDLNLKSVCTPLLNEENATRYGLNPLEVSVEGLEIDQSQGDSQLVTLEGLSNNLNAKLKSWFENNVNYLSGNMTCRGNGSIKVGQKVIHKGLNREFYVEGVAQSFQVFSDWHTQLTVTRGTLLPPEGAFDIAADIASSISSTVSSVVSDAVASATTQSDTQIEQRYHTVTGDDTLWSIAATYYGDGLQWTTIWEANKDTLIARDSRNADDPGHWIYTSQTLIIP